MKNYEKPMVMVNESVAEGVYAASGDCYSVSASMTQTPENGRESYTIQLDAVHSSSHHSSAQTVQIQFNQPVTYSSGGSCISGNGTNTLQIAFTYHANNSENHGLGNLVVTSDDGLVINSVQMIDCNESCSGH